MRQVIVIIPLASSVKFEDGLRVYRRIEQFLRRDLAFVTSITNRQKVQAGAASSGFKQMLLLKTPPKQGVPTESEAETIIKGLNPIRKEIPYPFPFLLPAIFLYHWRKWQKLLEVTCEPW